MLLMPTLAAIVAGICLFGLASAKAAEFSTDDLRLAYDDSRWRIEAASAHTIFTPIGDASRVFDPVRLAIVQGQEVGGDCGALAKAVLSGEHYVEAETAATMIDGRPALKVSAATRCRNATPKGVVLCIPALSAAYLLSTTIASCRTANNAFTGADGLDELAAGIGIKAR